MTSKRRLSLCQLLLCPNGDGDYDLNFFGRAFDQEVKVGGVTGVILGDSCNSGKAEEIVDRYLERLLHQRAKEINDIIKCP